MKPAVPGMAATLGKIAFRPPGIPIIGNCTGEPVSTCEALRTELLDQLCGCVQWSKSVKYMVDNGVGGFIEIGPGKVLTGLIKRLAKDVQAICVGDLESTRSLADLAKGLRERQGSPPQANGPQPANFREGPCVMRRQ
jgi:[acyl-carrier-protein] S-malonyltransferase